MITDAKLRELILTEEGQYHDRKSLLVGPAGQKRPRDRREVRDQIAEQVAGFANADGGVLILGVEDDGAITGHRYPADAVEDMLRTPEVRLVPPQPRGRTVQVEGAEVLVFEVDPSVRAVRVDGGGYPFRIADATRQYSEERINALKNLGLVESAEARTTTVSLDALDDTKIAEAARASGLADLAPVEYLVKRRLAERRGTDIVLRQAAVLLFARDAHTIERMVAAGFVTNADYRDAFGVSTSVAAKALARWVREAVLVREGERRGARYLPGPGVAAMSLRSLFMSYPDRLWSAPTITGDRNERE